MLEDEEQDRGTSRKFDDKQSTREGVDILNSGLYHQVTICNRVDERV